MKNYLVLLSVILATVIVKADDWNISHGKPCIIKKIAATAIHVLPTDVQSNCKMPVKLAEESALENEQPESCETIATDKIRCSVYASCKGEDNQTHRFLLESEVRFVGTPRMSLYTCQLYGANATKIEAPQ